MESKPTECVLLVRCTPTDMRLICKALASTSQGGLETETAGKVADAVERIRNGGVRAVIMDIDMEQGFVGFREVFSAASRIPILILSGTETECIARQAVDMGAHDYILKNHMEEFRLKRIILNMMDLKA
jgi:DNA-binding NarL/FixJ family response regulator